MCCQICGAYWIKSFLFKIFCLGIQFPVVDQNLAYYARVYWPWILSLKSLYFIVEAKMLEVMVRYFHGLAIVFLH